VRRFRYHDHKCQKLCSTGLVGLDLHYINLKFVWISINFFPFVHSMVFISILHSYYGTLTIQSLLSLGLYIFVILQCVFGAVCVASPSLFCKSLSGSLSLTLWKSFNLVQVVLSVEISQFSWELFVFFMHISKLKFMKNNC
jgi:hypothetical protein